ncbi:hypothetical protein RHAL1_02661 [Beijerinckiaceae bacterium RH AL1]|nr:hypothetical protein RHCH11_RHCH11_02606 [Beijerinckiaceae bacterium RH CH11]VVB47231.1 hypothetical protein RHAL8_02602 [Beijerinckiaceae bacterium RH AL8]VVC55739.1 hypothetical protein RHAL1_02661 [Beijerinckiaceae bacterium RH AL1]
MKATTTKLHRHHDVVEARRFLGAHDQHDREHRNDEHRGQVEERMRRRAVGELHLGAGRRGEGRRNGDADVLEQAERVLAPADGDGRGAHRIFEDEIPADDPGEDLAERRGGIGVGGAGDRQHRGELGIAEADEGAGDAAEHEGQHDRRPGVVGGGGSGQNEDAGADDRADAHGRNARQPERLRHRPFALATGDDVGNRFSDRQSCRVHRTLAFVSKTWRDREICTGRATQHFGHISARMSTRPKVWSSTGACIAIHSPWFVDSELASSGSGGFHGLRQ